MVEEAIKFGQYLKRGEEDIAEAIDIYRSLRNETFYGLEEEPKCKQLFSPAVMQTGIFCFMPEFFLPIMQGAKSGFPLHQFM